MFSIHLDYTHYGCDLEIRDKHLHVLLITQIIASWEKVLDLELVVKHAEGPKVFTQTGLGSQLSIVWEMVVPLIGSHVFQSSLFICYVIANVKREGLSGGVDQEPA
jgi:hypothetical protein